MARAGRALAWIVAGGAAAVGLVLRASDGPEAVLSGLPLAAAPWITWIGGGALALAAAGDTAGADRREGVEALVAARGFSPASLGAARVLAAMQAVAAAVGVPLVALSILLAALAGRPAAIAHRLGLGLGAAAFALVVGVTLGGAGAIAGSLGRGRGRWLLFAAVAGPWMLADLAGHGAWSIPGALGALLDFALGARSA
jgi:ABC-type transport system involved in multi-copper enzyme maturation permease subunit